MRILLVTDSHLAAHAEACNANWRAVRDYAGRIGADLTVHLGDITVSGAHDAEHLRFARALCEDWPTPIRFLPGNHDIGDNPPGPDVPSNEPLDLGRLDEYRAIFGPDHWSMPTEGGRLVALNAQLFGTGTPAEAVQWDWLTRELDPRQPIVLLLHKPLFQVSPDDVKPHIRYVPLAERRRLLQLLGRTELRIVLSGHTHQLLDRTVAGWRHAWLPSCSFFIPDSKQERIGRKMVGLGMLELTPELCRLHIVAPDGMAQHDLADLPPLY